KLLLLNYNKLSLSMQITNSKVNTLQIPFETTLAECFPLNNDYILITKVNKIYLFDIKNKIYKLLNNIKHDKNKWYKTINITKYYNKNNNYHFIILSCDSDGENLLSNSFELIFESNNKYKFNLK